MYKTLILNFLLTYILPLFYALLLGFALFKSRLLKEGGIPPVFSLLFLYGKILTGLLYTYIMVQYIPAAAADIDLFYGGGLKMYHSFWQNPAGFPAYLADIFYISDFSIGGWERGFFFFLRLFSLQA